MPQIIRNIRHRDIVATLGPDGFVPVRRTGDATHRCGPYCSCRTRPASTARDIVAKLTAMGRRLDAIGASAERTADSFGVVARKLHHVADQRREILAAERERAAAPGGVVSATSGFVRDAAGNRIRQMTPADLQAIHDAHYGRTR